MLKLIIADDERIIRETISTIINWKEYDIEVVGLCKNGMETYDMIMDETPDIVLTDIKMDTMNGLELVKKIQGYSPDIRVLLMSAYADFGYVKEAMKRGCSDYILKPIDEAELEQALRRTVEEIRDARSRSRSLTKARPS